MNTQNVGQTRTAYQWTKVVYWAIWMWVVSSFPVLAAILYSIAFDNKHRNVFQDTAIVILLLSTPLAVIFWFMSSGLTINGKWEKNNTDRVAFLRRALGWVALLFGIPTVVFVLATYAVSMPLPIGANGSTGVAALFLGFHGILYFSSWRYVGKIGMAARGEKRIGKHGKATPNFSDVSGMGELKRMLGAAVSEILGDTETPLGHRNGILLHGPPGVGKTFFAHALANEYNIGFMRVGVADLTSQWFGDGVQKIHAVFERAKSVASGGCLLFIDEFDAVAGTRAGSGDDPTGTGAEGRKGVNALLQEIDGIRDVRGIVLVAATNHLDILDPAIRRDGRFDYKIKVLPPDDEARMGMLKHWLSKVKTGTIDWEWLVRRTEGFVPADLKTLAMSAVSGAAGGRIEMDHLRAAIENRRGSDLNPPNPRMGWDDLILPAAVLRKLKLLQKMLENPDLGESVGVEPPRGAVFSGPPGTGKTSIARVLATEAKCSFYAVSAADWLSPMMGMGEGQVRRIFEKARQNRPSIIFVDEIDAVAGTRGQASATLRDSLVNQLLVELDGMKGNREVFVIGATNRPDLLDPAILSRLSEHIEIALPDYENRIALWRLYLKPVRTSEDVDADALARLSDRLSPRDIKSAVAAAGMSALLRSIEGGGDPEVRREDCEEAIVRNLSGDARSKREFARAGRMPVPADLEMAETLAALQAVLPKRRTAKIPGGLAGRAGLVQMLAMKTGRLEREIEAELLAGKMQEKSEIQGNRKACVVYMGDRRLVLGPCPNPLTGCPGYEISDT